MLASNMTNDASGPTLHPSFGHPGSCFVYRPKPVNAKEPDADAPAIPIMVPETAIYMLFAHRQWRAGMLLADAIYTHAFDLEDKCVLELGAGTGLPSLTAAICAKARKVVVTDYEDETIIATLRANARYTKEINHDMAPLQVAGHTWGSRMDDVLDLLPPTHSHFDVVVLADCVWERFSHDILLRSIKELLARSKDARIYMVAGLHTGRSTLVHFFRHALAIGLCLVPVPPADVWPTCTQETTALPGSEHIMELEVGGTWDEHETPYLTGQRRPFLLHRGSPDQEDEPIQVRNHWLTVSCMAWAATEATP